MAASSRAACLAPRLLRCCRPAPDLGGLACAGRALSGAAAATEQLPLSFSHVGVFCVSPAKLASFYTRFLGFTITDTGSLPNPKGPDLAPLDLVFLSRDPREHHQIALISSKPDTQPPPFNTINQISLRADGLGTLKMIVRRLAGEDGVSEMKVTTHGNAISVYFMDPEGNRVECFIDTPWYVSQPCREPCDFSQSDEEIMAYTETLARSLPGFCPREEWVERMRIKMAAWGAE